MPPIYRSPRRASLLMLRLLLLLVLSLGSFFLPLGRCPTRNCPRGEPRVAGARQIRRLPRPVVGERGFQPRRARTQGGLHRLCRTTRWRLTGSPGSTVWQMGRTPPIWRTPRRAGEDGWRRRTKWCQEQSEVPPWGVGVAPVVFGSLPLQKRSSKPLLDGNILLAFFVCRISDLLHQRSVAVLVLK